MNNIQLQKVDINLSSVVLDDVQYLKQHLDDILASSAQTTIENLTQETKLLLEQAKDGSKTYRERYDLFHQLTKSWFDVQHQYKTIPEVIDLIKSIDYITNYSIAYSYLFLSLSLINEDRIGDYTIDLKRIVSGFLVLSQTIDVFADLFSISELKQIYDAARNAISISARDVTEYFENGLELSNLVTQLRAYSSLIILKVEEHLKKIESTLEAEITLENKTEINSSSKPWWEQIIGTFANDPVYDEAMRLGQEYRNSERSGYADTLDV